jgi:hypothetical protein
MLIKVSERGDRQRREKLKKKKDNLETRSCQLLTNL